MAKSKGNGSGNGAGHNSALTPNERKELIGNICREVTNLKADRKVISDEINKIMQKRVKGDLGMKISDFGLALRLYQLEGDDRDQMLDTMRETFEALGVGEQLDWIEVSKRVAAQAEA